MAKSAHTETVVQVYANEDDAEMAVERLKRAGYPEEVISILANSDLTGPAAELGAATGATTVGVIGAGAGALAGIGLMAIPGFGPIVAAGWLAATATGALAGAASGALAGGLIGAMTAHGIPEDMAQTYEEALKRGMYLVCVKVPFGESARVYSVLNTVDLVPVDIMARRVEWRTTNLS